jgi:selenocysteine lyase/cysteine desulfurase
MDAHRIAIRFGDFHSRRLAEYLDLTENNGMVRVSMVHYNTVEEIDRMTIALDNILGPPAVPLPQQPEIGSRAHAIRYDYP